MIDNEDTIAAIATPVGEGAISIIRLSGPQSENILNKVFFPKNKNLYHYNTHVQYLGDIIDPNTENILDEALISVMREPKSYTAEDTVEIYSHGGIVVTRKILNLLISNGARIAEPGEFTKRAFLNGKIDLSQAESIIDIIRAKTDKSLDVAVDHLKGSLYDKIQELRSSLLEILAYLEVEIDFPEEDTENIEYENLYNKLNYVHKEISKLISNYDKGKIYREGINTVIIGRTNVGKSSLLNALLREKRAIVTDVPGTTRDVIEEYINVSGIPIKIIDTAGIRETIDAVEKIGVEKSEELLKNSDLVLYILDASDGITEEDKYLMSHIESLNKKALYIINKIDLNEIKINKENISEYTKNNMIVEISAKDKFGLENLEKSIENLIFSGQIDNENTSLITRERHLQELKNSLNNINDAFTSLENGMTGEFLSIDIKESLENLGKIIGVAVEDDIIDKIFSEFCLGK